jgi:predicted transposase YdaD
MCTDFVKRRRAVGGITPKTTRRAPLVGAREATGDPPETRDVIETILLSRFPTLTREEVRAWLHRPIDGVRETCFDQEVFCEQRAKGREEGHKKGRKEALRPLTRGQLTRRNGASTPKLRAKIQALSSEELAALGEALLDFRTIADLDAWLQRA